jgi:hypothetical protein
MVGTTDQKPKSKIRATFWWVFDKLAGQLVGKFVVLGGGWVLLAGGTALAVAHHKGLTVLAALRTPSIPLWVFLLVLLPAIFGAWVAVRRLRRRSPLYVTADPLQSVCIEGDFDGKPAMYIRIRGAFTNMALFPQLLIYAYLKGTTCLTHFYEPVSIGPGKAIVNVDVQFQCTRPKRLPRGHSVNVVFVDAGGFKHPQQLNFRVQAAPAVVRTPKTEQPSPQ